MMKEKSQERYEAITNSRKTKKKVVQKGLFVNSKIACHIFSLFCYFLMF